MNAPDGVMIAPAAMPPVTSPPAATSIAADAIAAAPPLVATGDAKRIAGAILEVLAGVRSITDAALLLGVVPARYYQLEARALVGFIAACEPRARGPVPGASLQVEIDRLRAERDRLREEAARYQALARIAQSAFGPSSAVVAATSSVGARSSTTPARSVVVTKPRKKRVATVRALRLARHMQEPEAASPPPPSSLLNNAAMTTRLSRDIPTGDQAGG